MKPLLNENERDLFEVVSPNADAPLMVCCDHASWRIPESLDNLGLQSRALDLHIACDIGAGQVATLLAHALNAPLLLANYSRLVIDLNRHPDDATSIPQTSDQVSIPGNLGLSHAQRQQRVDEMFFPYHDRYGEMVGRLQGQFARPMIVAVHSFAAELQGVRRPWDIGVLWEHHHDLAQAMIANLSENADLRIGENQPYHACDPLGYAMCVHAQARNVEMALIEIRQDLIADRRGQQWAADVLHRALAPLVDYSPVRQVSG